MSDHPGIGVMLGMLGGNEETVNTLRGAIGKRIVSLGLRDDALRFEMEDGTKFRVFDDGQSCCESRYMMTDDDLTYHVGAVLVKMEIRGAANVPEAYGDHEIQFLDVTTDRGVFQMATHNEHNGYYGGFWIRIAPEDGA